MMMKHPTAPLVHRHPSQRGLALIVALIILAGVTLISLAGVNTSTMELRMALNEEAKGDTFQTALAALDFVIADSANLPATGPLFTPVNVALTGAPFEANDVASAARIEDCAPPPRARSATSLMAFSAFEYEVSSDIDRNQIGMGHAAMAQGYILLGPKC
jgi:Tfp pilus assembly protein PilX